MEHTTHIPQWVNDKFEDHAKDISDLKRGDVEHTKMLDSMNKKLDWLLRGGSVSGLLAAGFKIYEMLHKG